MGEYLNELKVPVRGTVVVLSGLPGSGKSTFAKTLTEAARDRQIHVCAFSADSYFTDPVTQEYKFDPSQMGKAQGTCLRNFVAIISMTPVEVPCLLIIDNTNLTIEEMAPYCALAQAFGYDLEIVVFYCREGDAARRNTHGVSPEQIHEMYRRSMRLNPPRWWPQPVVIDTSSNFEEYGKTV